MRKLITKKEPDPEQLEVSLAQGHNGVVVMAGNYSIMLPILAKH